MTSRSKAKRTREKLYDAKRTTYQRMRICVEIDVPDEHFDRDSFNKAAVQLVGLVETPGGESMLPGGCRVVLITTEDAS
jgi:hypothetical protein